MNVVANEIAALGFAAVWMAVLDEPTGHLITVRELIDHGQLEIAYTTVMTTMDRLHKKGLLSRIEENRAFRYFPLVTKEELQRQAAGQVIQQLLASGPASLPLSYLVEAVTDHDKQLLDELQQLVENKRRELRDQEKD